MSTFRHTAGRPVCWKTGLPTVMCAHCTGVDPLVVPPFRGKAGDDGRGGLELPHSPRPYLTHAVMPVKHAPLDTPVFVTHGEVKGVAVKVNVQWNRVDIPAVDCFVRDNGRQRKSCNSQWAQWNSLRTLMEAKR